FNILKKEEQTVSFKIEGFHDDRTLPYQNSPPLEGWRKFREFLTGWFNTQFHVFTPGNKKTLQIYKRAFSI
ncbi:MAG: hypothetical protein L0G05_07205, partial [Chryseobacterium sp.]|nr:hypothetical protein [Chryseobacterium sp.]